MNAPVSTDRDVLPAPPLPLPSALTASFWAGTRAGELRIQQCVRCSLYVHPPRSICPRCRSVDLVAGRVSGRARVSSWTVVERAFHPWFEGQVPYILVAAELHEQHRLMFLSRLVDCEEAAITPGMELGVVFEALSDDYVVPVFRPRPLIEGDVPIASP